jgi:cyclophilin family peptidyl-prolyl cis-trans isomerase
LKFQVCAKDSQSEYEKVAADAIRDRINHSNSSKYSFITFDVAGTQTQVVFELFHSIAPRTSDNFFGLCKQFKNKDGEVIGYGATDIHRIVKGMYIQMGKIKTKNADCPTSIYSGEFADESFHVKHTEVGLLGMCKRSGL